MRARFDERGQAAIEAAIILPLVMVLGLLGLQSLWSLQCGDALASAIEHVRHSVRPGDECAGEAACIHIKNKLVETQPLLAAGKLEVRDAAITQDPSVTDTRELPDEDFDEYSIATKNVVFTRMRMKATVVYEPPAFFSGAMPTYGRNVDAAVLVEERFEVG